MDKFLEQIKKELVGCKIVSIRYMDDEEREAMMWYEKAVIIELDSGVLLYPSSDDEGNNPGAIFTTAKDLPTIPVWR